MTASTGSQLRRRRRIGAAITLPSAMPANTQASMIVNAYAVGLRKRTNILNHTISRARDIKPETKNTHSTNREPASSGTYGAYGAYGASGAYGVFVPGAGAGAGADAGAGATAGGTMYPATNAITPMRMFVAAAIWKERATPISAMK